MSKQHRERRADQAYKSQVAFMWKDGTWDIQEIVHTIGTESAAEEKAKNLFPKVVAVKCLSMESFKHA